MTEGLSDTRAPLDFREYLSVLWRRRLTILLVTVVVFSVGLAWSLRQDNVYEASGRLAIQVGEQASAVPTESRIIEGQRVHTLALEKYPGAGSVSTEQDGNSNIIVVTAESSTVDGAVQTVTAHMNAYADFSRQRALKRYEAAAKELQPKIDQLQQRIDPLTAQIVASYNPNLGTSNLSPDIEQQRNVLVQELLGLKEQLQTLATDNALAASNQYVISDAGASTTPVRPKPTQDGLIALAAGLLLGVALAFVVEFLDDTIKSREDLVRAVGGNVPVLGAIPTAASRRADVVSLSAPDSPAAEAYRALRTSVYFVGLERGRSFAVTSARPREGRTTTTVNLAVAIARAGQRVVVVDCDLRRPRVHDHFGLPNDVGFTSVLLGEPLSTALRPVAAIDQLSVLTSGPIPPNPAELLASARCAEVFESLLADGTLLLIDTPAILPVTDAAEVARIVDSVLLVTTARLSTRKRVRQAVQLLQQIGAPLVGTVLNAADESDIGPQRGLSRRERRERQQRLARSGGSAA